ncbi:MAG: protein translocase subunit SecD [Actinobacteria bacterium]|jgi:protein-export membrane protein SecD|nr:protein translocase subunit SecD [Actinomycetota bacterium]
MKPQRYRIFLALSIVIALGGLAAVVATGTSPRLGLDLEGGTGVILTAQGEVRPDVLDKTVGIIRQRIDALGVAEPEVSRQGERNILIQLPGVANDEKARRLIGTTAQLTFRQVEEVVPPTVKKKPEVTQAKGQEANAKEVVYPSSQSGEQGTLYRLMPAVLTGDIITQAEAVLDPQGGGWSVSLDMNDAGAATWAEFTKKLACLRDKGEQIKSQVAIVLDGRVESAAGMSDPATAGAGGGVTCAQGITGGQTSITVGGQGEARELALVLRTGALPITLEESEVTKVSPTLGRDSLDAGFTAGALGLGLVILYMLLYYRALGLVVLLGLVLFTAALYTVMAVLGATAGLSLSLAGVAGIIVSVGITADSYIVAFERLKDEMRSGKSVRAAVERGMARAFRTILVADFVTAAAAVILFFLAVGPVRGFALTLGLATLIDVLIAYFFTRSAVALLARSKSLSGDRWFGMRSALGVAS